MTIVATLFPAYNASDFDLEIAAETPKRLVITKEDARRWAEMEICEGRDKPEWEVSEWADGKVSWTFVEDGAEQEWVLVVEDVPFWKP